MSLPKLVVILGPTACGTLAFLSDPARWAGELRKTCGAGPIGTHSGR